MLQVRQLDVAVTGAAAVEGFPLSAEEKYINSHADLLAWIRPGVNLGENTILDRSKGLSFNKTSRMLFPVVAESGSYNNRPVFTFSESVNMEARSAIGFMPATGPFSFAFVGHFKDLDTSNRAFLGSDGGSSSQAFALRVNDTSKRIELKLSSSAGTVTANTGASSYTVTSEVPILAIVGYDPANTRLRIRVNRGASDVTNNSVSVGDYSQSGDRTRLQLGTSGGDDFGVGTPLRGGALGDVLAFGDYIFNDEDLITAIDTVLGDYYDLP